MNAPISIDPDKNHPNKNVSRVPMMRQVIALAKCLLFDIFTIFRFFALAATSSYQMIFITVASAYIVADTEDHSSLMKMPSTILPLRSLISSYA